MRPSSAGLLSPSSGTLARRGSGSFRAASQTRKWLRRAGWSAVCFVSLAWVLLQVLVSHPDQEGKSHGLAPKFWADASSNTASQASEGTLASLPPAARPDFREEETICAEGSEKCEAVRQAKEKSYAAFKERQLVTELGPEAQQTHSLMSQQTGKARIKRKGLEIFQLLTSRFRRRATLPECKALEIIAPRLRTIAIVGNGPLSAQQRHQIQTADVVIRFNKLNNRFCGERLDVWVVRFGNTTKSGYHGINEVIHCTTAEAIGRLSSLWFLDTQPGWQRQNSMTTIIKTFSEASDDLALHRTSSAGSFPVHGGGAAEIFCDCVEVLMPVLHVTNEAGWMDGKTTLAIDKRPLTEEFHQTMDNSTTPSSGWIGLRLAERCRPWGARIHLFGYNWSPLAWSGHKMSEEQKYAQKLEAEGKLVIHRPPCRGFRTCDGCAVVAGYDAKHKRLACADHMDLGRA